MQSPSAGRDAAGPSAFTPKALLLGCLFTFFVAAGDAYGVFYLRGSYMTLGTSTVGALGVVDAQVAHRDSAGEEGRYADRPGEGVTRGHGASSVAIARASS